MNIDLLENIELVHGAAEVYASEEGFSFVRMTPEILDFYGQSEATETRANCSSGVRICFNSNTSFIAMRLSYGRSTRPVYAVDIVLDDTELLTFSPDNPGDGFSFTAELSAGGERRIEIHLPHLCESVLNELIIEDGATLTPVTYPDHRIIFIGDSITQGMTTTSPTHAYATQLAKLLESDFHNISVGGAAMKQEIGEMALGLEWNTAFVAYGVNDCAQSRSLEGFAADTVGMLRHLSERENALIYLLTPIPWLVAPPVNALGLTLADYRKTLCEVAADFKSVKVIDGLKLVPDKAAYFADGCHPNDYGMEIYATSLFKQLT